VADKSRSKTHTSGNPAKAAASARRSVHVVSGDVSVARTVGAALVGLLGIAWMVVYLNVAQDGKQLTWMGDLGRWNFVIGFGLLFVGLALLASPRTPLGRGRGVVVGMLGCFLLGLLWIIVYYMAGQPTQIPVFSALEAYNLVVGIGFMAVGFIYATRWE
jgi:drug/metabolite transporter (DMT)-like permease